MSQIILETHWFLHYLHAAWIAGCEAHQRDDSSTQVMLDETYKIALMAVALDRPEK